MIHARNPGRHWRAAGALLLALLAVACGSDPAPPVADPDSQRPTAQGPVVGYTHPGHAVHVWRGLPFAAPPVGPLRWRAPQPPASWQAPRAALEPGPECPQLDMRDPHTVSGDEDCLYLDVYAPRFAADAVPQGNQRRPVMVWIHGGGNSIGSARVYDASRLVADGDVIVVAIQYRLGVLGWLSHPALRADAATPEDASGNYGTLDAIHALRWVQDNIAAFGGDPGNVTVFGESAGGIDVFALLLSPLSEGLFQRAISQSGILVSTPRALAEQFAADSPRGTPGSNEFVLRWLQDAGRAADPAAARDVLADLAPADLAAFLRGRTPEQLLAIFGDGPSGMYGVPMVIRDGHVIPDLDPLDALATPGQHIDVPTIAGTNREETKLFAMLASPHVDRLFGLPVGIADRHGYDLEGAYGGLLWKARGVDEPLQALAAGNRHPVWGYRFDWDELGSLLWLDLAGLIGAGHAVELLFVFGFTDLGAFTDVVFADVATAEPLALAMRRYWTQFARTGDPGRGGSGAAGGDALPEWVPWRGGESSQFMVFDSASGGGNRMAGGPVTVRSVVGRLGSDSTVRDDAERCRLLRGLVQFDRELDAADYLRFAGGICAAWPLPWPAPAT